ncbi:hypothetical protein GCM10008995_26420 [Halobellus salinus]|uniref:Uncharacterized protein n=1 Tax=Halobellus salinus TaxID=931585 RepID=A0A830EIN2_9EURY|nr:hypothetical protein [Halobellus salinus]GGJ15304.1 hypothetical protein GCM10008995_26420 [Halobellus salinus]
MVLDRYDTDPVIKSWQKLLEQEAESRGTEVDFQSSTFHFILEDNPQLVAGVVHKRKSWEYSPPNTDQIFFEGSRELDAESRLSECVIFSVILDLYSQSREFDPEKDHFLIVPPEDRKILPGNNDRFNIYVDNPSKGGSYYYYKSSPGSNRKNIKGGDWGSMFKKLIE